MSKKFKPASIFTVLIVFLICTASGIAQGDYQKGFVITKTNDTLFGKVSDRKTGAFGSIYKKVRFKEKRKKKRFHPNDIKGYQMGEVYFKSLFLDGEMTFVKVVSEGYLSHYIYELQEQGEQLVIDIDYIQKGYDGPLVRATQGVFGLKRKRLANFLGDCPEVVEKIQNKETKHVSQVVDFYNHCKSQQ